MKVLFLTLSSSKKGKANIDIYNNAAGLVKKGHEVHLVTRQDGDVVAQDQGREGVKTHPLALRTQLFSIIFFPIFLIRILFLIRETDPDVVIAENNLHCPLMGLWGANLFNKPYGLILRELTADAIFYDRSQGLLKRGLEWIVMKIDHTIIYKVDGELAINDGIASYYESKLGLEIPARWMIGYPMKKFMVNESFLLEIKEKYNIQENERYLIYTGSLQSERGLESVIRALSKSDGKPPYHLLVTGEGRAEEKLKQIVNNMNLADRVKFLGWVSDRDLFALLQLVDIGLEPYSRPWPQNHTPSTKVALYVAGGLFVICTPAVGYEEIVREGRNCIFFRGEDELLSVLKKIDLVPSRSELENDTETRGVVDVKQTTDHLENFLMKVVDG